MLEFLPNNAVTLIFVLYVLGNIGYWVYNQFYYKETRDDWFNTLMFYQIAKKSYLRHPGFVGKRIKISDDTHMIKQETDESFTRIER